MGSGAADAARIKGLDRRGLVELWERVKARDVPEDWNSGKAFEYLIVRAFELEGNRVRWPYGVTYPQRFGVMEQVDGLVYLDNRAFLVESKDYAGAMGIEAVAKLRFRLEGRPPGTMGLIFSGNGFATAVEVFAQFAVPLNVLLWSGADLDVALPQAAMTSGLRMKLEYAMEEGLPLFPLGD